MRKTHSRCGINEQNSEILVKVNSEKTMMRQTLAIERWQMLHDNHHDFAISCWQTGTSPIPLTVFRVFKLVAVLGLIAWSLTSFWGPLNLWLLYMTHWGITALAVQSSFGLCISGLACAKKLTASSSGLPWYVKTYWVLFNISAPVAFLITLFYWIVLYGTDAEVEYAPNPILDFGLHGLNSIVMLLELATAGYPSRLLHVYQPVGFGLLYLIFGVIYYLAGGVDPWGNPWVYPVIDWRNPGPTVGVVAATTVVLFLLHFLTVGLSKGRTALTNRLLGKRSGEGSGVDNAGFVEQA